MCNERREEGDGGGRGYGEVRGDEKGRLVSVR